MVIVKSDLEGHSTIYSGKCLFLKRLFLACTFFRTEQRFFFKTTILLGDYVYNYIINAPVSKFSLCKRFCERIASYTFDFLNSLFW